MENKSDNALKTIIIAVVIALVVGGTAPWWWNLIVRQTSMGPLEQAINRQGGDIANFPVNSPQDCSRACEKDDRCKAMTFVRGENGSVGVCWLKENVAPMSDSSDMVSAVKRFK